MAMNLFNREKNTNPVIRLLQASRGGFRFDRQGIKAKLLSNIEESQLSLAERRVRELAHKSFFRRRRLATFLPVALLVVAVSGAALAQADLAKPGSKLHALDQMQEQFWLKLPLPESQKAQMQANIAGERNRDLDYLLENEENLELKMEAVRESQESLNNAVEQVLTVQEHMVDEGKDKQAEKLGQVLQRLELLAEQQEEKVELMKERHDDVNTKERLNEHLEAIKKARLRAHLE